MADAPMLAEGIADYLAAVRRPPEAAVSLEAARLIADRDAHRIAGPRPAGMRVTDSYVPDVAIETAVRIYRPAGEGALPDLVAQAFPDVDIDPTAGLGTAPDEARAFAASVA